MSNVRSTLAIVFCLVLTSCFFTALPAKAATTIYVPDNYPTIQAAVNAASSGDTIIVRNGTYTENVNVNKDHLTIRSQNGALSTIVQAANPNDNGFEIVKDYITISGFTVKEVVPNVYAAAIWLYNANYCVIRDNIITNNNDGIWLNFANNNTLTNNNVSANHKRGIFLWSSSNNNITNNTASNNDWDGIFLWLNSNNNTVEHNTTAANIGTGIVIYESPSGNTVSNNNVSSNKGCGIYLLSSNNNYIYQNNFIDNVVNAVIESSTNTWNSLVPITYSYNDKTFTKYLGNYWSDYTEIDCNGDGIGDTPYNIASDKDNYPLMETFENGKITPVVLNKEQRKSAIYKAVQNNKSDFLPSDFPSELVLAVAAQETGEYFDWNNELVSGDWGRGIMQITTNEFVGAGSCCLSEDCIRCRDRTAEIYCYRFYSNTSQGIEANIKDGLYTLKKKYNATTNHYSQCVDNKTGYSNCTKYGISCEEMRWISAVQGYRGYFAHAQDDPQKYLKNIKNKLNSLHNWFPLVDQNKANDLAFKVGVVWDNSQQITILSPCDLLIYDSEGRMSGLVSGEIQEEIPFSIYYGGSHIIFIPFPTDSYRYLVSGTNTGTYGLTIDSNTEGTTMIFTAADIPTSSGELHQYTIDWDALAQGQEGVTIQVDSNGDGTFEETISADGELTHDEFVLQIATTVDFQPDTLNLKSKGELITVYVELPPGYEVGQIDISSIRLNGIAPALAKPTQVGDYDRDGVRDLMVKLDGSAVRGILGAGDQIKVTVSGKVAGISFKGSDIIRVINKQ